MSSGGGAAPVYEVGMFSPGPSWDKGDTKEVGKAVLIAALSAFVAKLAEWGVEGIQERLKKDEPSKDERDDDQGSEAP